MDATNNAKIELCNEYRQKNVIGVLCQIIPEKKDRKTDEIIEPEKIKYMSVGEGMLWITNELGNIEKGDYITTGSYKGYGVKQMNEQLCNYTIAKAIMDCDFKLNSDKYECYELKKGIRVALIAVTFCC